MERREDRRRHRWGPCPQEPASTAACIESIAHAPGVLAGGGRLAEELGVRDPDRSMGLRHRPLAMFADEDAGHPDRPLATAAVGEPAAALHPRHVTLDMNVEVIGDQLDVAVTVAAGCEIIEEFLAGPPLTGVGSDVHGIGPFGH